MREDRNLRPLRYQIAAPAFGRLAERSFGLGEASLRDRFAERLPSNVATKLRSLRSSEVPQRSDLSVAATPPRSDSKSAKGRRQQSLSRRRSQPTYLRPRG